MGNYYLTCRMNPQAPPIKPFILIILLILIKQDIFSQSKVVVVPGTIQLTITYTPTTCAGANGSIIASATGGTGPYQFSIDGVSFQSNGNFTHLYNTTYLVVVQDATGQRNSQRVTIDYVGNSTLLYVPAYINPTDCAASDGSITVKGYNPYGDRPPFLYSMDGVNFQSNNTFSNLSAGNYTFFVQNADGCIDTAYFPIEPNCTMQGVWDYSSRACQSEGHITVQSVTGGTAPYQYSLNGGAFQSSASFTGLSAGSYKLRIRDATGKIMLYFFPIFQGCSISATATPVDASCGNNDGSITVAQTGGTVPYSYSIDGTHFQASNVFTGLPPGEYNVTVNDAGGLQSSAYANIINNCSSRVTAVTTNTSCLGNNGKILATVVGGISPFQYSIDGVNFQSSRLFTFVPKGTYTVTAIDATGVKMMTTVTVIENPLVVPHVYALPTSCSYDDGIIIVTSPGTGTYEFGLTPFDFQSSNVFKNLYASALYTVYMRDSYGCVTAYLQNWVGTNCINVTAVTADARCGASNGSITATGTSGAEPYSYSIDGVNFQPGNTFTGLPAATYTLTIRGANGASNSTLVTVKANCLQLSAIPTDANCGKKNGSFVVTAVNGTAPYQYSMDGVNYTNDNFFKDLPATNYTVFVKDAGGTVVQTSVLIRDIAGPQLNTGASAATCRNNDGIITLSVNGGTAPFVYSATLNGVPVNNFTGVSAGQYQVTVTDGKGCAASGTVTVPLTNDLTVDVDNVPPVCEGMTQQLRATSTAGEFSWSPTTGLNNAAIHNPILTAASTQAYTVTAISGPCQAYNTVLVTVLPAPVAVAAGGGAICFGKSATLSGSGGVAYSWTPATYLDDPRSQSPTVVHPGASITYTLSVTGANGCPSIQPAAVTVVVSPPALLFAGNDTTLAIGQPLQLQAVDVNNTGFTSYSWVPAEGLNNPGIANPVAVLHDNITYKVTAYSDAGCEASGIVRIKVYEGPEIYVPNAFTPNGDGHNDVLKAIPAGIRQFRSFMLYNRFGQLIFSTADPSRGWDGAIHGQLQPAGVFVWQAEGVDYMGHLIRRKGTVILVR